MLFVATKYTCFCVIVLGVLCVFVWLVRVLESIVVSMWISQAVFEVDGSASAFEPDLQQPVKRRSASGSHGIVDDIWMWSQTF